MRVMDLTLSSHIASIAIVAEHVVSVIGETGKGAQIQLSTGQVVHVRESYSEVMRFLIAK